MSKAPGTGSSKKPTSHDVDQVTKVDPAITHETVKPVQHEIVKEHIEREIHNHDVYTHIQPVIQREVLPARHYVQAEDGSLTQVEEKDVPSYFGMEKDEVSTHEPTAPTSSECSHSHTADGGRVEGVAINKTHGISKDKVPRAMKRDAALDAALAQSEANLVKQKEFCT